MAWLACRMDHGMTIDGNRLVMRNRLNFLPVWLVHAAACLPLSGILLQAHRQMKLEHELVATGPLLFCRVLLHVAHQITPRRTHSRTPTHAPLEHELDGHRLSFLCRILPHVAQKHHTQTHPWHPRTSGAYMSFMATGSSAYRLTCTISYHGMARTSGT